MSGDLDAMKLDFMKMDGRLRVNLTHVVAAVGGRIKEATKVHDFKNRTTATEASIPDPVVKEAGLGATAEIVVTDPNALRMNAGTPAHDIFPRGIAQSIQGRGKRGGHGADAGRAKGQVLRFEMGGTTVFARRVRHPGTPAYGWLDKAADAGEAAIDALVEAAIDAALGE